MLGGQSSQYVGDVTQEPNPNPNPNPNWFRPRSELPTFNSSELRIFTNFRRFAQMTCNLVCVFISMSITYWVSFAKIEPSTSELFNFQFLECGRFSLRRGIQLIMA